MTKTGHQNMNYIDDKSALKQEMLDAFLKIEPQDAHVKSRRETRMDEQAPVVALSVAERRHMTGATGVVPAVEPRPANDAIVTRMVDSPGVEYAQYLAETQAGGKRTAGKTEAQVNLRTLLGGFYKFRGTEAQNHAASIVKSTWERSLVGGDRAVDPSIEHVDGGYRNPEAVFEQGIDARKLKADIEVRLGSEDTERLVAVVVAGAGPTAYAKWRYQSANAPDGRTVKAGVSEVCAIADRVAVMLKLQSKGLANVAV